MTHHKRHHYVDDIDTSKSLRKLVWDELDKNPLIKPQGICRLLQLNYKRHGRTVTNYRSKWKYHHVDELGSKPSSSHNYRAFVYVSFLDVKNGDVRDRAVQGGWVQTKSRNRHLLWKDQYLGRLMWFETGRVNIWVRKPRNTQQLRGKISQLIANGFFGTYLVTDMRLFESLLRQVKRKSTHFVFETRDRLPQLTINFFEKSNGITIKIGDRSHPHAVEVICSYPEWGERMERLMESFKVTLDGIVQPMVKTPGDLSYVG